MRALSEREKILIAVFVGLAIGAGGMYCALDRRYDKLNMRIDAMEKMSSTNAVPALPQDLPVLTVSPYAASSTIVLQEDTRAALDTSTGAVTRTFEYPYPLVWTEGGITYSLTGLAYGYVPATKFVRKDAASSYKEGEIVHALVLYAKLRTGESGGYANLTMRRVLNEEGDMVPPNVDQFYLQGSGGIMARPNTSYTGQPIYFLVEPGAKEFIFTTGGASNKFFTVRVLPENVLDIEVEG